MYERDKQIYKCSTMRQGGKFDAKNSLGNKPSILNCPLPEIPKSEEEKLPPQKQRSQDETAGPGCTRTFQRTVKMPGLKPIQPPKIITTNSQPTVPTSNNTIQVTATTNNVTLTTDTINTTTTTNNNSNNSNNSNNTTINPNDESNYAVTEL